MQINPSYIFTIINIFSCCWSAATLCPLFDDLFADIFHSVLILYTKDKQQVNSGDSLSN